MGIEARLNTRYRQVIGMRERSKNMSEYTQIYPLIVWWRPHNKTQMQIWRSDWSVEKFQIVSNDEWTRMQEALKLLAIPVKEAPEIE